MAWRRSRALTRERGTGEEGVKKREGGEVEGGEAGRGNEACVTREPSVDGA